MDTTTTIQSKGICMFPKSKDPNQHVTSQIKTTSVTACGISETGAVRSKNEDAIFIDEDGRFMLVADGMGGQEKGEDASTLAIETIKNALDEEVLQKNLEDITVSFKLPIEVGCIWSAVKDALQKANASIFQQNQALNLARYMGTTLVGFYLTNDYIIRFHVGDSRLYRFRSSRLTPLTTDHSLYEEWVQNGRVGVQPKKNILTRALGVETFVNIDMDYDKYHPEDIYMLCSDGISTPLSDEEIQTIIQDGTDIFDIPKRLVNAAIQAGSRDNLSVIVCTVNAPDGQTG